MKVPKPTSQPELTHLLPLSPIAKQRRASSMAHAAFEIQPARLQITKVYEPAPPPTLFPPLTRSPHLSRPSSLYMHVLSRPPLFSPHMLDHSGSFGWSTREVPSTSTRTSTGKSIEKAKPTPAYGCTPTTLCSTPTTLWWWYPYRVMTHTSMCVPHQKYVLN